MKDLNPWYSLTYDEIRNLVNWYDLDSNIEIKIVLIFSWMPNVIMNAREYITVPVFRKMIKDSKKEFEKLPCKGLWEIEDLSLYRENIKSIFSNFENCLGGVAASKYLHFTRPDLLPMFDRKIKNIKTGLGYYRFMKQTSDNLKDKDNMKVAKSKYRNNPLRGWDIHLMENRP